MSLLEKMGNDVLLGDYLNLIIIRLQSRLEEKNDERNGRLACKTHNLSSAVHALGRECMQKWLPGMR